MCVIQHVNVRKKFKHKRKTGVSWFKNHGLRTMSWFKQGLRMNYTYNN